MDGFSETTYSETVLRVFFSVTIKTSPPKEREQAWSFLEILFFQTNPTQ